MQRFGVKKYLTIGSMYDMVPHTRKLRVSGRAYTPEIKSDLRVMGIQSSEYQGPVSITTLISHEGAKLGIQTMSLMVHLPQYTELDEDYAGYLRIAEILNRYYRIGIDLEAVTKAEEQRRQIDEVVAANPQLKYVISQLEAHYDSLHERQEQEEMPQLAPEVEKFLKEMEKRFGQN